MSQNGVDPVTEVSPSIASFLLFICRSTLLILVPLVNSPFPSPPLKCMRLKLHVRDIHPLFTCFGFSCLKLVKKRRKNNAKAIRASNNDDVTSDSSRTHDPRPPSVLLSQFSLSWFSWLFSVISPKMKAGCTFYCHFYVTV